MSLQRPTIALCMIMKNEAHNLSKLLQSVRGCFDEICITDTGSTDNTVEFLERINEHIENGNPDWLGLPKIKITHFEWVNDFAKARNFSFQQASSDFLMWLDGDDVLHNKEAFIEWRDTVMHAADYWVAEYLYHFNQKGECDCNFLRERVVRNRIGFVWKYFVHEGIINETRNDFWQNKAYSWEVHHQRTEQDVEMDHGRNTSIFDFHMENYESWEPRMWFYLGKELLENGKMKDAGKHLLKAIQSPTLEMHDRILATQFAAQSAFEAGAMEQFFQVAFEGLKQFPNRAELYCIVGDAYAKTGDVGNAILYYKHALNCMPDRKQGVVLVFDHAYRSYPLTKLATLHVEFGAFDEAEKFAKELLSYDPQSSEVILEKIKISKSLTRPRKNQSKVTDVIFTTAPQLFVTGWSEKTYSDKGWGGSETAIIQVSKHLAGIVNRKVKIFSPVGVYEVMPSGVEMVPHHELNGYIKNISPSAHICWRHVARLTPGPTYVWCHDLVLPGLENGDMYDYVLALSGFHKNYLHQTQGVDLKKVLITKNGIDAELYQSRLEKNPLKVIWPNSPDRGLELAIQVLSHARDKSGIPFELHCFYGFDNMLKGGQGDKAQAIMDFAKSKPWVFLKGNVSKAVLRDEMQSSSIWLYTANFIETYCITALEALCSGTYPIVRRMGALSDTLRGFDDLGMCEIIDRGVFTSQDIDFWADRVIEAYNLKKWENVSVDPVNFDWKRVSEHFAEMMRL